MYYLVLKLSGQSDSKVTSKNLQSIMEWLFEHYNDRKTNGIVNFDKLEGVI
jgi:hypothetical protein